MYRITLQFGGKPVRKYNFEQETVCIGRDADCEVLIDNIGVSRRHATIEKANGEYILTDLKSHNGTFVHGQRIYHHQLNDGDEFFIGKYSIQFENLDAESQEPVPVPVELNAAGMQDMTFRLDKGEIEKIMGASSTGSVPKLSLIAPQKEQEAWQLEGPYFLIGADESAGIRIKGFLMPAFVAMIVKNDKWYHVVSLSKKKPVTVKGERVMDHQLGDGEEFRVAKKVFRFAKS
jgi:pSer/pThr/pTyr-binding forkhead associated (FHA) protein